eukprot:3486734-Pleurochrysis_carterae.AAC.3
MNQRTKARYVERKPRQAGARKLRNDTKKGRVRRKRVVGRSVDESDEHTKRESSANAERKKEREVARSDGSEEARRRVKGRL